MKERIHGGKAAELGAKLDFSSNLNPFLPESLLNEIREMKKELFILHPREYPSLLESEIEKALGLKDCVCPLPGSIYGLHLIFEVFRPKRILSVSPSFNEYRRLAFLYGAEIAEHKLREEEGFRMCLGEIASKVEEEDVVIICNPNNPTGSLMGLDEIKGLVRWCENLNAVLVLDEAFIDFSELEGTESFVLDSKNLVILRSFTKSFGIAGLRLGYLLAHPEKIKLFRERLPSWCIPRYAEEMGVKLLKNRAFLRLSRMLINREKIFLIEKLKELGFHPFSSAANFLFVKSPLSAEILFNALLQKGILVRIFPEYPEFSHFFRISVRKRSENLELISALREALT